MNLQLAHLPSIKSVSLKQSRSSPASLLTDYLTFPVMSWPLSTPPCSSAVVLPRLLLTDEGTKWKTVLVTLDFFHQYAIEQFLRLETSSRTIHTPPPPNPTNPTNASAPKVGVLKHCGSWHEIFWKFQLIGTSLWASEDGSAVWLSSSRCSELWVASVSKVSWNIQTRTQRESGGFQFGCKLLNRKKESNEATDSRWRLACFYAFVWELAVGRVAPLLHTWAKSPQQLSLSLDRFSAVGRLFHLLEAHPWAASPPHLACEILGVRCGRFLQGCRLPSSSPVGHHHQTGKSFLNITGQRQEWKIQ